MLCQDRHSIRPGATSTPAVRGGRRRRATCTIGHRFQAQEPLRGRRAVHRGPPDAAAPPGARTTVVDPATGDAVYTYELAGHRRRRRRRRRRPRGLPGLVRGHPGRAFRRAAPLRRRPRRARRGLRARRVPPVRQAAQADPRVRRAGHDRQHRVLRRRRPPSPGAVGRRVLRRPHLVRTPGAHRCRRVDRALELPAPDGRLEDPPGDRGRQHDRAQARRAHPADLADVRRRRPPRPASRTVSINIVTGTGRDAGRASRRATPTSP